MPKPPSQPPDPAERLTRLEESHAFTDRQAEELAGEVRKAFDQIHRLATKLERLEARLQSLADSPPDSAPADETPSDQELIERRPPHGG